MPPVTPVTPVACYGAPVDFTSTWKDYVDPKFSNVPFRKLFCILWVDVGFTTGLVPYRFVAIYMRAYDGSLVGTLPLAQDGGSGDDGSGVE